MALPPVHSPNFAAELATLERRYLTELDQSVQSLREIGLMIEKTNSEIEKLSTREMQVANRVRDMELHIESFNREDIRDLYQAAGEVQMRVLMMRSQADQLQLRQQELTANQERLRLISELLYVLGSPDRPQTSGLRSTARLTGALSEQQETSELMMLTVIEAQEDERLRLARHLNDGPTQALANLMIQAEICERLLSRDVGSAQTEIANMRTQINASLQEARRLMYDLRPLTIGESGLLDTLERYLHEIAQMRGMRATLRGPEGGLDVAEPVQIALYRLIQGSLSALFADGLVDSIEVGIGRDGYLVHLHLHATGVDTDPALIQERMADPEMVNRLLALNATLQQEQPQPFSYVISMIVPVPQELMAA